MLSFPYLSLCFTELFSRSHVLRFSDSTYGHMYLPCIGKFPLLHFQFYATPCVVQPISPLINGFRITLHSHNQTGCLFSSMSNTDFDDSYIIDFSKCESVFTTPASEISHWLLTHHLSHNRIANWTHWISFLFTCTTRSVKHSLHSHY